MTSLLEESLDYASVVTWIDKRILLPGYSDQLAYENEFIDTSKPLKEVKADALVNPENFDIEDENFSRKLRNLEK